MSTDEPTTDPQERALAAAGLDPRAIVREQVSGAVPASRRPSLAALLARLAPGDVLAVARLDRLGRDPADVLSVMRDLENRGVAVRLLDMGADTATPAGRLIVAVLAAVAGWERDVLRERTRQGMAAARARGEHVGRRHRLTPHQRAEARRLRDEGRTIAQVAKLLGCGTSIVQRAMTGA